MIRGGHQKRKSAKTPGCKKWPFSNKRKLLRVWRSGQGQRVKPEDNRAETASQKSAESHEGKWCQWTKLQEEEREEEPSVVLRRRRTRTPNAGSGTSFCREAEPEVGRRSPTSAGSTSLSLCRRSVSLFRKREFLLLPDIISFPSEYRTEALLNRI